MLSRVSGLFQAYISWRLFLISEGFSESEWIQQDLRRNVFNELHHKKENRR